MALRKEDWNSNVRKERTGWRDAAISDRHRQWGFNCPSVDIDFLLVEYNLAKPVALIEYKHYLAQQPDTRHATYRALTELADHSSPQLPFLIAFYWPDIWAFRVTPVNVLARQMFDDDEMMTEREYVKRLYRIREMTIHKALLARLNDKLPRHALFNDEDDE